MARKPLPVPASTALVDANRKIRRPWIDYLTFQSQGVAASAQQVSVVNLTAQAASIAATALPIQTVTQGQYRVNTYVRVTQAATASSSIQVTISWTESSVALTASATALTGNTTTTVQGAVFTILSDGNSPINYATTYASVGATPMQYRLYITVEKIDA